MKLTLTQLSAHLKLSPMFWKTAYDLQVSLATLNALVRKGWAESKVTNGYMFSPRTCIYYRACRPTPHAPETAIASPTEEALREYQSSNQSGIA